MHAVSGRYVWVYASIQFVLVVLFAHLFYSIVSWKYFTSSDHTNIFANIFAFGTLQIHMQAIVSIMLATFAGFGVTMSGSSVTVEILRWRRRWRARQRNSRDLPVSRPRVPTTSNAHESSVAECPVIWYNRYGTQVLFRRPVTMHYETFLRKSVYKIMVIWIGVELCMITGELLIRRMFY